MKTLVAITLASATTMMLTLAGPASTGPIPKQSPTLANLSLDRSFWTVIPYANSTTPVASQKLTVGTLQLPTNWGLALTHLSGLTISAQSPVRVRVLGDGGPYASRRLGVPSGAVNQPSELSFDPPLLLPPNSTIVIEVEILDQWVIGNIGIPWGSATGELTIGGWKLLPNEF